MNLIGKVPIMAIRIVQKKDPDATLRAIEKAINTLVASGVKRDDIAVFAGMEAIVMLQEISEHVNSASETLYPSENIFDGRLFRDKYVNSKEIYVTVLSGGEKYQKSVKARYEAWVDLQKQIMESYCNFKKSLPKLEIEEKDDGNI